MARKNPIERPAVIGTGTQHRQPLPRRWSDLLERSLQIRRVIFSHWVAILVCAVFFGLFGKFLLQSEYFKVDDVAISGNVRLNANTVKSALAANDRVLSSLGTTDQEIIDVISELPQVRRVNVTREWPSRIAIDIQEFHTSAILAHSTGTFLIAEDGTIFDQASGDDFFNSKDPIVTGFDEFSPAIGKPLPRDQWNTILRANIQMREANPTLHAKLSEWHWGDREGLTLVFEDGMRVVAGFRSLEETGPTLEAFLRTHRNSVLPIALVDLRSPEHITWRTVKPPSPSKKTKRRTNDTISRTRN